MEREDLLKILHGDIAHISKVNENDMALYNMEVVIHPKDVRNILQSYLKGKMTSNDLTNWAGFICIRGEYCTPGFDDDEIADYYEDMYYVIQRLSTPEIDGEITEDLVRKYLEELEKYPN